MLVFWKGDWVQVSLPACVDPSWGTADLERLAFAILKGSAAGLTELEVLEAVEAEVYGNAI